MHILLFGAQHTIGIGFSICLNARCDHRRTRSWKRRCCADRPL